MSHFVRPKRPRNRTAPDATYDKTKIVSIIGNKAAILLHSVLKEIHEWTALGPLTAARDWPAPPSTQSRTSTDMDVAYRHATGAGAICGPPYLFSPLVS